MADDIAGSSPAVSGSTGTDSVQSTGTTVQSDTQTQTQGGVNQTQSGEPPRERWESILSNARTKASQEARQAAEAEFKQRFQPYETFESDPWRAVQDWLNRAEKHTFYGPQVQQYFQSRQQQAQPAAEPAPDVPIVDENGHFTGKTYSAERLKEWQRWNDQQTQAKWEQRLSPIEQREQARAQREQQQEMNERSQRWAQGTLQELRAQPYFKEHEADIAQAMSEHKEWGANIHQAYNFVLATKVLPNLSAKEAQSVINSLQDAGAATTVAPGVTTPGKPKFKNFGQAAEYYSAHPEEAAAMAGRR